MAQKKGPDILNTTKSKSKKNQSQLVTENKEVADLKKMMKKETSIRRISEMDDLDVHLGSHFVQNQVPSTRRKSSSSSSSPNYMKPTASSDARKDQLQQKVSEKEKNQQKIIVSSWISSSSPPSSSSSPCNTKTTTNSFTKPLTRKSSLKLAGPLMKKNKEITSPFPKINASRATCSSTIKDSRFPKELVLSPGATDSEGTSAFKVCPYTYCSLNGHRHEPLPPLKSYMSTRRKLLKTQKSKQGLEKGEKSKETSACVAVSPLTDEVSDDLFVEIYAELSENTSGLVVDRSENDGCSPETSFEEKEVGSWKDYSDDHSDSYTSSEPSETRDLEDDCREVIFSYLKDDGSVENDVSEILEEKQIQKGGKDDANLQDLSYYNSDISVKEDHMLQSELVRPDHAERELEDEVTHSYLDNCLIESGTTELLEEKQIQEEERKLEDEVALSYLNNCSSEEDISEILEEKEIQEECTYDTTLQKINHYDGDNSAKEDVVENDHVGKDKDHSPLNELDPDGEEHKLVVEVTLSYLGNCLSENDVSEILEEGNRDISIKEDNVENDHVCNDIDHILQSKHLDDAENKLEDEETFSYEHICLSENDVNEIPEEKQIQEVGNRDISVKEDLAENDHIGNDTDHIPQNEFFHPDDAEHKLEDYFDNCLSENDVREILEEKQIQEEGNRNTSVKEDLVKNEHVNNDIDHILQSELVHPDNTEHELEDEVTLTYPDNCLIENKVRDKEDSKHDATLRDLEHYNCDISVNEDLVEDHRVGNDIYGILQNEFVQPNAAENILEDIVVSETSPPETDLIEADEKNSEYKRFEGIKDDTDDESEYTNLTVDKEAEVDSPFAEKKSDLDGSQALQDLGNDVEPEPENEDSLSHECGSLEGVQQKNGNSEVKQIQQASISETKKSKSSSKCDDDEEQKEKEVYRDERKELKSFGTRGSNFLPFEIVDPDDAKQNLEDLVVSTQAEIDILRVDISEPVPSQLDITEGDAEKDNSDLNNFDESTDDTNHELECTRQIVDITFSDKKSDFNGLEAIQDLDAENEVNVLKGSTCLPERKAQEEDMSVGDDVESESENKDGLLHKYDSLEGNQPEIGDSNFNKDREDEISESKCTGEPEELQENGSGVINKSQEDYMSENLASIFNQILLSESDIELKTRYDYTRKMSKDEQEELKSFNPRGPNFLPIEPDPEAETVNLKHQILEDKKNSEEWMIDYALQRTVSRLRRVRKRKVAVLVEAFETVSPTRRFESSQHDGHDSQVFAQVLNTKLNEMKFPRDLIYI